jgi:tetratricopeptide (TPR) repeat protein
MTSDNARLTESVEGEFSAGPTPEVLDPGSVIADRYEIRRVLGSGGYAIVYLAYDRRLNSEVALKAMRADRNSPAALTRFRREVNIAREAASPRLVRVYDIGIDGDLWYLTMEVVRGESLRDRIRRGPIPITEAIEIIDGILDGLAALHALKIVHRDLKPENILLDAAGSPKLADFGLARFLDEERSATATGAVVGTTDYLSPEQALGHAVDSRGDLYALGVVLFEMLTGRLPFKSESSLGSVIARLRSPAPSVRRFRRDVPLWLSTITARLLSKEPRHRYASASDVQLAIQRRRVGLRTFASRRTAAMAIVVILACAGVVFAPLHSSGTKFSRIEADGEKGIVALGTGGEKLWKLSSVFPQTQYALAHLDKGRPVLAMVMIRGTACLPKDRETLSFLDPETGKTIRDIKLPDGGADFPGYTNRFGVLSIAADDLDGDGFDEIIVGYNHIPEAPSYIVLYEPRLDRARIIFEGMGHHRFVTSADLDGDGRKEVLISGINNGVNWYNALAAIRLSPPAGDVTPEDLLVSAGPVRSPDMFNRTDANLLWYTLLPRGLKPVSVDGYRLDPQRRAITLMYGNRAPVTVSYDGFLADARSSAPPVKREQSRRDAWLAFCKTRQLLAEHFSGEAVDASLKAVRAAEQASDTILTEVMRCQYGKALVAAGRSNEAQTEFRSLVATSENAMELSYDAGRAFHLHGELETAVDWYRRGLAAGSENSIGKNKAEYIQAIVFALGELGQWNRALREVDNFHHVFNLMTTDAACYREFARWRTGATPRTDELSFGWNATDVRRYWLLEYRNANTADPATLLPDVEREISWRAEPLGPLWSLKAELLARTGKTAESADAARRAWEITSGDAKTNLIARGHLALVRERMTRYAGK